TRGTTASLRSIIISCECGREASMAGFFRSNALIKLMIKCYGERPWLGEIDDVECTEPLRTLQRGSSAAWFPVVRSAISIPPWTEGLHYIIGPYLNRLSGCTDAEITAFLKVQTLLKGTSYTADDVIQLVREIER